MNRSTLIKCCERAAIEARKTDKSIAEIGKLVGKAYDSILLDKYGGVKQGLKSKPKNKKAKPKQMTLDVGDAPKKPQKQPTFPFGKYKGLTLEAVQKINPSYYSWAEGQGIIKKLKK